LPRHRKLARQLDIKPRKDGSLWIPDFNIVRKHIDGYSGPKPTHRSQPDNGTYIVDAKWVGKLRDKQMGNVSTQWMRQHGDRHRGIKAILANDVGCGKTLEAIQLWIWAGMPMLTIICPVSVKMIWPAEFEKWVGYVPDNITIVNYERVMADGWKTYDAVGQMLIVDEAHRMSNRNADTTAGRLTQAECVRQLSKRADHVLLLTATPARNHPEDIWGLLNVLDPVLYSSYWVFCRAYFNVWQGEWGWVVDDHRDTGAYGAEVGQWMTRATRHETFPDLDYSIQRVPVEMPADLLDEHDRILNGDDPPIVKLTYIRKITSEAKMRWLDKHLLDAPKTAAFTNFTSLMPIVSDRKPGCKSDERLRLKGGMSDTQRASTVKTLWDNPGVTHRMSHIIVNYKAGGEGIDLSCCKQAVLVDLDYTSTGVEQAIGRLLRPKQTERCVVVQVPDTGMYIDDYIYNMVIDKSTALLPLNTAAGSAKLINEMQEAQTCRDE
jgi:hypothetical protein